MFSNNNRGVAPLNVADDLCSNGVYDRLGDEPVERYRYLLTVFTTRVMGKTWPGPTQKGKNRGTTIDHMHGLLRPLG